MALVHHQITSLHGGVSNQSPELRFDNQCEEMLNCVPSIDKGTRRRNPSTALDTAFSVDQNAFVHAYDKGLAGNSQESYTVIIDNGVLTVRNTFTGELATVNATADDLKYLQPYVDGNGYAALTIGDGTIIVNKNKSVSMYTIFGTDSNFEVININTVADFSSWVPLWEQAQLDAGVWPYFVKEPNNIADSPDYNCAPSVIAEYYVHEESYQIITYIGAPTPWGWGGSFPKITTIPEVRDYARSESPAVTNVTIDGVTLSYKTAYRRRDYYPKMTSNAKMVRDEVESYEEWRSNLADAIQLKWPEYEVNVTDTGIEIYKAYSGTPVSVSVSISYSPYQPYTVYSSEHTLDSQVRSTTPTTGEYLNIVNSGTQVQTIGTDDWDKIAYVWIKDGNAANPFTYTVKLDEEAEFSVSNANTELAADAVLAGLPTGYTGAVEGSVVQIWKSDGSAIQKIRVSDSFGDQASFGWVGSVSRLEQLPAKIGFNATVHITGDDANEFDDYYVYYNNHAWVETVRPLIDNRFNITTMPHILKKTEDGVFSFESIDWGDRTVGDYNSSENPSFVGGKISDVFFFRSRLCFTSGGNVIMSETDSLYNFWRTTVLSVLDSDPIDISIDSIRSVDIKHATALSDYVMLFSDKEQFKLAGGDSLTPKSVYAHIASAYEYNRKVVPLSIDNRVYFAIRHGEYSGILEYSREAASENTEAIDITSHIPVYLDGDITQIVGSSVSKMLFVRTSKYPDTLYVYNYMFRGRERVQSAWHKWKFNGDINSIACFGNDLYMSINRRPAEEALSLDYWDDDGLWEDSDYWIDAYDSKYPSYETLNLEQLPVEDDYFYDVDDTEYESYIDLSEWVYSYGDQKDIRGHLQFKTTKIETSGDSIFDMTVTNLKTEKARTINQKYVVGKKPFIMGQAKDVRIRVSSINGYGFQIDAVSYEGRYNSRSRRT